MTRNEAHSSDNYPRGRGRSLPEPPPADAIEGETLTAEPADEKPTNENLNQGGTE